MKDYGYKVCYRKQGKTKWKIYVISFPCLLNILFNILSNFFIFPNHHDGI